MTRAVMSMVPDITSGDRQPVQITIGGLTASVASSDLVEAGLYQFNVTVPSLPNGDAAVVATIGGVSSGTGVSLTVGQ